MSLKSNYSTAYQERENNYFKNYLNMNDIGNHWVYYWFGVVGSGILAFLMPISSFLVFVIVLVFVDMFTGVKAAQSRKENITSIGLRRSIEKIVLYFIAILLSEGLEVVFFGDKLPLTYGVSLAIATVEFRSNIENIETITGVKVWSTVRDIINRKK